MENLVANTDGQGFEVSSENVNGDGQVFEVGKIAEENVWPVTTTEDSGALPQVADGVVTQATEAQTPAELVTTFQVEELQPEEDVPEQEEQMDTAPLPEEATVEATTELVQKIVMEAPKELDSSDVNDNVKNEATHTLEESLAEVLGEDNQEVEASESMEESITEDSSVVQEEEQTPIEVEIAKLEGEDSNTEHDESGEIVESIRFQIVDDNKGTEEQIVLIQGEPTTSEKLFEECEDDPIVRKPKRKGRKTIALPLHVLGRNITCPGQLQANGRPLPKPRLGVKVPSCNLASQILSKEEIEREVMERLKVNQKPGKPEDVMFARKLTKRLAQKLAPQKSSSSDSSSSVKREVRTFDTNYDLLAILEGNDDDPGHVAVANDPEAQRKLEREIALKQLEELPNLAPKILSRRGGVTVIKKEPSTSEMTSVQKDIQIVQETLLKNKKPITVRVINSDKPPQSQVKVIKTYSRKRKVSEPSEAKKEAEEESSSQTAPTPTYITKSSRIIKKKVIWEPDGTSTRALNRLIKQEVDDTEPPPTPPKKEIKRPAILMRKSPTTPTLKTKKRLTEVDKLLMDEGAVNMLYDVSNTDEPSRKKLDRAPKDMVKKATAILNDLHQNKSSPKSLRKKDNSPSSSAKIIVKPDAVQVRKQSKDSTRSSLHTPPPSPKYSSHGEASRIIRRRSSSSFSSNIGSEVDDPDDKPRKKLEPPGGRKKRKQDLGTKPASAAPPPPASTSKISEEVVDHDNESLKVTRTNKLVKLEVQFESDECYFTIEILRDLVSMLDELAADKDCNVVVIRSNNKDFSLGLDYKTLIAESEDERKVIATELAECVRDFLKCLLNFPKIIVAGVQGRAIGLAVTMLPLFDMVVASDTAVFSTNYATLGCMAEAGFLLTPPYLNSHGLAAELLFAHQELKADEAMRRGLITKLCWPEKYNAELTRMVKSISNSSKQSLEAMKSQLRHYEVDAADKLLNAEVPQWVDHWISPECQESFAQYIAEDDE